VPVPEVLWEDAGDPPDVPPLFVMSFVEGASLEPLFDLDGQDSELEVAERMRNAARTLAMLHTLDPAAIGLANEPVVGPEAEIDRWCRLLETIDPVLVPGWPDVAAALRQREPSPIRRRSCTATSGSATSSPLVRRSPPSSTGRSGRSVTPALTRVGFS
jgi:aminoglycoside phosphotransferase (APT) family kinase protein